MSALEQARDHHLSLFERFVAARSDEPAWLRSLRREAAAHFGELGLPHTKLEEWRYTNVAPLAKLPFELCAPGEASAARSEIEAVAFPVFACSLHVFVDGRYEPRLSALGAASEVHVESLAELLARAPERVEPYLGQLVSLKEHAFAALGTAFLDDGAALLVGPDANAEEPLHVVFVSTAAAGLRVRHPRVLIVASEGSRVRVIVDHVSLGGPQSFTNAVAEVCVGQGAQVDLVLLQRERSDTFHVSNLAVRQERDSRFSSHTLTLGGVLVRNDLGVVLEDEGADCTLHGLFLAAGDQLIDNHTLIDHAMPHGTSRELYKGILGGSSRGVFRGRVIVRPGAQKTDAKQSNPNLVLADSAEIDTKPQLEIYADDVKCSHGSSIGQLEDDALFYLRSRGLAEPEARDLLTRGFAHEVMAALPVPALTDGLDALLDTRLAQATGRGGAS
jgi:Fe-S cluster assembly protein SufD